MHSLGQSAPCGQPEALCSEQVEGLGLVRFTLQPFVNNQNGCQLRALKVNLSELQHISFCLSIFVSFLHWFQALTVSIRKAIHLSCDKSQLQGQFVYDNQLISTLHGQTVHCAVWARAKRTVQKNSSERWEGYWSMSWIYVYHVKRYMHMVLAAFQISFGIKATVLSFINNYLLISYYNRDFIADCKFYHLFLFQNSVCHALYI